VTYGPALFSFGGWGGVLGMDFLAASWEVWLGQACPLP